MNEDLRITIADVRRAGYCVLGARRWCRENGYDFATLVKPGLSLRDIHRHRNDAIIEHILKMKIEGTNG